MYGVATTSKNRKEHREDALAAVVQAMAEHVVELQPGTCRDSITHWRCFKPGTGMWSFNVLFGPDVIVMWGDIGELILRPGGSDRGIGWLRSATTIEYFFEKASDVPRVFLLGQVALDVRDLARQDRENGVDTAEIERRVNEVVCQMQLSPEWHADITWHDALSDVGWADDSEFPTCDDYSAQKLIQFYALHRFVRIVDARDSAPRLRK